MGAGTFGHKIRSNVFLINFLFVFFLINKNFSVGNNLIEETKITKNLKVETFLLQRSRTTKTRETAMRDYYVANF